MNTGNGLIRWKVWLEVIGGAVAVTTIVAGGLIAILAAFGPFETRAQHSRDVAALQQVTAEARTYREDTRTAVHWLVCVERARQGAVSAEYCDDLFPVAIPLHP